jgi:V8-like Glu-specific endopeptidase
MAFLSKLYTGFKTLLVILACSYLALSLISITTDLLHIGPAAPSGHEIDKDLKPLEPSRHESPSASTIRIYRGKQFYCSGVVIGKNYLLTAAHCLVDPDGFKTKEELRIESIDKKLSVPAKAVGINTRMDWGLVAGDFSQFSSAILESVNFEVLDKVLMCGYPQGATMLHCMVNTPYMNDYFFIKCKGIVFPGMSGGPVFDGEGHVIGLNVAVYAAEGGGGSQYTPTLDILANFGIGPD